MERAKIKQDLLTADFSEVQSETLSYIYANMATKGDIDDLRVDMQGQLRAVRQDMAGEFRAVRQEMAGEFSVVRSELKVMEANLGARIAESTADVMKTMVGFQNKLFMLMLALVGTLATVFTLLDIFID